MSITQTRRNEVRQCARVALLDHDFMSLPVRPKLFAEEKLGMEVVPFSPTDPSISGYLMRVGSQFGIGFSTAIKSEGFRNFTIAHELGHYFIDGHPMTSAEGTHYSRSGFISKDRFEQEADIFATEFLMPSRLVEPIAKKYRGFPAIKELAEQCGSSLVASAIRYVELTDQCVAVVVSHFGSIEFMVASKSFRGLPGLDWLHKGEDVPDRVPTKRFARNLNWIGSGATAEEGTTLSEWFPSVKPLPVEEDIVGLGSYQRLLTVLLVDESGEDDSDEDEDAEPSDDYIERWGKGQFRPKK